MTKFPVIDSVLSPKPIAILLQERYGLGNGSTCKVLRTGINHTYLISDHGEKYVFRAYSHNWRTETDILEELRLLNLLRENSMAISYPLLDNAGEYIQRIDAPEGLRYAVLFSYAEGDKTRNLTEDNCYSMGLFMGQFHRVSIDQTLDRMAYDARTLTQLPYQYAREYFSEPLEEMEFIKSASEHITSTFQQVDGAQLRYGIVHLDLWYDNMNIDRDSRITVFDFDFCGNGWLLLDIAYCVMQLFHTEPDKDKYESKLTSFYEGYEAVSSITAEEKKLLPLAGLAVWIFYLGVQAQRFDNWSNIFLSKNYLKHYIAMVKSWLEYHAIEIKVANAI